jgi:sulfur relay (sulfurtransferase) DsrF/TusC family protein
MAKILNIVETAYRGTLEEQDDTILWLSHALKNAGADIAILLRANAVNYSVKGQDASGLAFGGVKSDHPPQIDKDLEKMIQKGIPVYLVQEDLQERGLPDSDLIDGIKKISRKGLPELLDQHDQVWHW